MQSDGEHERIEVDDQRVPDSGRLVYTSVSVPSLVLRNLVASPVATSAHESSLVAGSPRSDASSLVAPLSAVISSYSGTSEPASLGDDPRSIFESRPTLETHQIIPSVRQQYSQHNVGSRSSDSASSVTDYRQLNVAEAATNRIQGMSMFVDVTTTQATHQEDEIQALQSIILTASYCYSARDYARMIDLLQSAVTTSTTPSKFVGAIEFGKGIAHLKLKHYDHATSCFLKIEFTANKGHLKGELCLANYYLGEVEYTQSKFLSASRYYYVAVERYSRSDIGIMFKIDTPSRAVLCCKVANSLRYGQKIMEAISMYQKAIDYAKSGGNRRDELSAHTSLGNLYQGIGDHANAITQYELTSELAQFLEDRVSLGWVYGNLGSAHLGQNKPDKALSYLERSLELTLQYDPTPQSIGRAYNNLGTAYQSMNHPAEARKYYDMALSQALYGNDLPGQARVNGNLGNLHMIQEKYEQAIKYYSETLALSRDRSTQTTAYHNRGCAQYELAEVKRAQYFTSELGRVARGKSSLIFVGSDVADCEVEHQFPDLYSHKPSEYSEAKSDLERVQKHHEQTFQDIKGSPQGLNLSVSLFESHSRTFQRLQDCCYLLGNWQQALVYAEQSRARTLGELMLQKNAASLKQRFHTPLDLSQIQSVVQQQVLPVVYLSYTTSRLLVWVMVPLEKNKPMSFNMFQVTLDSNQFDGKSFEHMLRLTLSESLTDARVQMYGTCSYTDHTLLNDLYDLIIKPLKKIIKMVPVLENKPDLDEVILILDTYSKLIPMAALQDPVTHQFLGDNLRLHCMHSLLTMGILDQVPESIVRIPMDSPDFCIVGNPSIPRFEYNDEQWNLGRLPFATEEAEWIAHILHARPTLHEQATKDVVMTMLGKAKVVHLATHGSSAAGFLVFAGVNTMSFDPKSILLQPREVEGLVIPAALVILSSCDSGRGALKAEGIQGIARSFLLAGAQSVLTSLWRVPDESASFFMQFFYRYLVDGYPSFRAIQKATLSIRCFTKYGDYIHWSGYQLTGRQIQFESSDDHQLKQACGSSSPFPRLAELRKLETSLISQPQRKTDLQFVTGCIGMCSVELVVDYLIKHEAQYTGGIFWVDCTCNESISTGLQSIAEHLLVPLSDGHSGAGKVTVDGLTQLFSSAAPTPTLLVLANIRELSLFHELPLSVLVNRPTTHIVVTSTDTIAPETVANEAHRGLIRGCNIINLKPLTWIQSAQRVVYFLMSLYELCPMNEDQELFEMLADLVRGSPYVIDVVCHSINALTMRQRGGVMKGLREFEIQVLKPTLDEIDEFPQSSDLEWTLGVFISKLLTSFNLSALALFSLSCLSLIDSSPCHVLVLLALEEFVTDLVPSVRFDWEQDLHHNCLVRPYPRPVVQLPLEDKVRRRENTFEDRYFYVPDVISTTVYNLLEPKDKVMACGVMYRILDDLVSNRVCEESHRLHFHGLQHQLLTTVREDLPVYSEGVFTAVFQLYMSTKLNESFKKSLNSDP